MASTIGTARGTTHGSWRPFASSVTVLPLRSVVCCACAMVDGGFAMGSNLPLFAYGEGETGDDGTTVTNSEGETVVVPKKADFGTVSSGGLY